jgi:hypothetical protein
VAVAIHEDVRGLDVAVDHPPLMRMIERLEHVGRHLRSGAVARRCLGIYLLERRPVHQL